MRILAHLASFSFVLLAACLVLDAPRAFAQQDEAASNPGPGGVGYKIVIHADNPTTSLDASTIAKMFLKKVGRWENGERVEAVDQLPESPVREAFSAAVHGNRSIAAITAYWQRMIFSGRGVPPKELPSDQAVLDFVRQEPGGIGYVAANTELGSGVKVLKVTGLDD